jgi:NADPH:quinone reductase-like Zn-dependent oxidoreductase
VPKAGPINQGDDISGTVHAVGANVTEFKVGDRVAAFHEMMTPHGSYAEYALSWNHTTFHLPKTTSFEEGAAIPLAAMTAALGLYQRLGLPEPWQRNSALGKPFAEEPLVIWGAGSAVGSYALQLAARSNIHPILCVAGKSVDHVKQFLDPAKGDVIFDYRPGNNKVVENIKKHLGGKKLRYAFDAVSEHGSYQAISEVLDLKEGRITLVLPGQEYPEIPASIAKTITSVGSVHKEEEGREFAYVFFRYFSRGLKEGWFKGQPTQTVPGGLGGIQKALKDLKDGKASAVKYVFRIDETEGLKSSL